MNATEEPRSQQSVRDERGGVGSSLPGTDSEVNKLDSRKPACDLPEQSYTLNLRSKDEPTAEAARAKEPEEVMLLVGGAKLSKGEARWYYERLEEIEQGEHVLRFLLLSCLSTAEREQQGFTSERPRVLQKDDQELLQWQNLVVDAKQAADNPEDLPKLVKTIPKAARLVIRSAIAIVRQKGEAHFVVRRPWKKAGEVT